MHFGVEIVSSRTAVLFSSVQGDVVLCDNQFQDLAGWPLAISHGSCLMLNVIGFACSLGVDHAAVRNKLKTEVTGPF